MLTVHASEFDVLIGSDSEAAAAATASSVMDGSTNHQSHVLYFCSKHLEMDVEWSKVVDTMYRASCHIY